MKYVLFRNKQTNEIEKYDIFKNEVQNLEANVLKFNGESSTFNAEIVENKDIIAMIELAERNKKIKLSDLKDIEYSVECLRNDVYDMIQRVK